MQRIAIRRWLLPFMPLFVKRLLRGIAIRRSLLPVAIRRWLLPFMPLFVKRLLRGIAIRRSLLPVAIRRWLLPLMPLKNLLPTAHNQQLKFFVILPSIRNLRRELQCIAVSVYHSHYSARHDESTNWAVRSAAPAVPNWA